MKGLEYLLKEIDFKDVSIKQKKNQYIIQNKRYIPGKEKKKKKDLFFDGNTFLTTIKKIKKIISLNETKNEQKEKIIIFKMGKTFFKDKAAYILFESLLYLLCRDYFFDIKLLFEKMEIYNIYQDEVKNLLVNYQNKILDKEKYKSDFLKFFISNRRFRKIVKYDKFKDDKEELSKLADELAYFFKSLSIEEGQKDVFAETLVELVGNACEHGESDCLIDINLSSTLKKNYFDQERAGLDIVIYNFSESLFGTGIKNILTSEENFNKVLKEAYLNHKNFFNSKYKFDDFCNIAAFQWRISSREKITSGFTGGTGLTTLIRTLIKFSEKDRCYIYSGKDVIYFIEKYLTLSSENKQEKMYNLIGFNEESDFINYPPSSNIFASSPFYLNGTLYNLIFIIKKIG